MKMGETTRTITLGTFETFLQQRQFIIGRKRYLSTIFASSRSHWPQLVPLAVVFVVGLWENRLATKDGRVTVAKKIGRCQKRKSEKYYQVVRRLKLEFSSVYSPEERTYFHSREKNKLFYTLHQRFVAGHHVKHDLHTGTRVLFYLYPKSVH